MKNEKLYASLRKAALLVSLALIVLLEIGY